MSPRKPDRLGKLRREFSDTFGETSAKLRAFALALGGARTPATLAAAIKQLAHDVNGAAGLLGAGGIASAASALERAVHVWEAGEAASDTLVTGCVRLAEALEFAQRKGSRRSGKR